MPLPLVLITGVTGFVGSHILQQALDAGFPVRVTSRVAKANSIRQQYGSKVDVVIIDDISTHNFTEALNGVGAVIHVASPMPGKESVEGTIYKTINGAMNLLRQATEAGVPRYVLTSSVTTVLDICDSSLVTVDHTYSDGDWNPANKETALDGRNDILYAYMAAKTEAERAVWKFAEQHSEIDITTFNPPFIYGPLVPGFPLGKEELSTFSTVGVLKYWLLSGIKLEPRQLSTLPFTVDVRDLAKAHILALTAPTTASMGKQKRFLISGPSFSWIDAVEYLTAIRPELASRLSDASEARKIKYCRMNVTPVGELLNINEFIDWKKTVEDAVDSILKLEQQ